jgi:dTDP-4-dehydrorhamnose 3,5-epimerase
MGQITVEKNVGGIEGLCVIQPAVHGDNRGYFMETYSQRDMAEAGLDIPFVQDNQSKSSYGVLRGLHFQKPPYSQSKLVRCVRGRVLDVAVDIRKSSPTFGKYVTVELTEDNHRQLFIPHGFAHGFVVLSEEAIFQYKCDNFYHKESEGAIAWNDPEINIDWTIPFGDVMLSDKDKVNPLLKDAEWLFE